MSTHAILHAESLTLLVIVPDTIPARCQELTVYCLIDKIADLLKCLNRVVNFPKITLVL